MSPNILWHMKYEPKIILILYVQIRLQVWINVKIFDRNDIRFEVGHVWTMRGPSFANVKDKRVTKERPPGPEGYHRPPPPPDPATLILYKRYCVSWTNMSNKCYIPAFNPDMTISWQHWHVTQLPHPKPTSLDLWCWLALLSSEVLFLYALILLLLLSLPW